MGWLKFVVNLRSSARTTVKCSSVNAQSWKLKTYKTLDLPSDFHYYYGDFNCGKFEKLNF